MTSSEQTPWGSYAELAREIGEGLVLAAGDTLGIVGKLKETETKVGEVATQGVAVRANIQEERARLGQARHELNQAAATTRDRAVIVPDHPDVTATRSGIMDAQTHIGEADEKLAQASEYVEKAITRNKEFQHDLRDDKGNMQQMAQEVDDVGRLGIAAAEIAEQIRY